MKDFKIFITSRSEDQQLLTEFRQLSQAMLQNGASVYDISTLYTTNSIRQMQKTFKDLQDKQEQFQAQEQQLKQSELQLQQKEHQDLLAQNEEHHQQDLEMEKYKTDVKANIDIAKAEITTYFQAPATDTNGDGSPDIMEIANHAQKAQEILAKVDLENKKMQVDMQKMINENKQKAADRQVTREQMKNDLQVEKLKIKNKPKPKPAKK